MNSLERHVLKLIGENADSPDVFADTDTGIAQIRTSIGDAIQELCMVTGTYVRTTTIPLYTDRMFYRLGFQRDHFGWIVECWDRSRNRRLENLSIRSLFEEDGDFLESNGNQDAYFQVGHDIIGVWRRPSAMGTVLEATCVLIPKHYTSEKDPIRLRHIYETAAVYYAVSEFYASRGNAGRSAEYHNRYLETANLMNMQPVSTDAAPVAGGGRGRGWAWGRNK